MKLSALYEYVDLVQSSHDFYGDPKSKAKKLDPDPKKTLRKSQKDNQDLSLLVGGTPDRNRFLKATSPDRNK